MKIEASGIGEKVLEREAFLPLVKMKQSMKVEEHSLKSSLAARAGYPAMMLPLVVPLKCI